MSRREKANYGKEVANELERQYVLNLKRSLMDPGTFGRLIQGDSDEHSF